MTGAAPVNRSSAALLAAAAASAVLGMLAAPASTRVESPARVPKAKLPAQMWGIEVDGALLKELSRPLLARMRKAGVNTLVADTRKLQGPLVRRARRIARRERMVFLAVHARPCRSRKAAATCVVMAASPRRALALARARAADVVVVRVPQRGGLRRLRGRHAVRILALQPLDASSFDPKAWRAAIATARAEASLDLAVYSTRRQGGQSVDVFLGMLGAKTVASAPSVEDTQPPSVPQGLTMTANSTTTISLVWNASTDDVGVAGYNLWRDGVKVASTASTSDTYSSLACGKQYTLAVEAYDAAGNVSNKAEATTRRSTVACSSDTQAPSVPQGLTMTANTRTSISLAWTASTDNVGVAGYHLWRDGVKVASTTSTSYTYSGLVCGTQYTLAVEAYDAAGGVSSKAEATTSRFTLACSADTQAPSVPQGLTMTANGTSSISLAWNTSTDDVGVAGYHMWRDGVKVASTTSTSHTYSALACGTQYTLAVEAYDAAGNVSNKAEATTWRSTLACAGDAQAPSVSQGLSLTLSTETTIALAWSPSTDNVGVSGYNLWRGGVKVASTALTAYTFSGLSCGTSYTLAVEAYDAAGNVSNRAEATTVRSTTACAGAEPPPPPPPPPPGSVLFVSPSGSDTNPCTQAAPCLSLNRAYRAAAPGSIVEMAGGVYGAQRLVFDASKTSPDDVVFQPAPGATVVVRGFTSGSSFSAGDGAKHFTVKGIQIVGDDGRQTHLVAFAGTNDMTLIDIDASNFYLNGVKNVLVKGGDWGPCLNFRDNWSIDRCSNSKIDGNSAPYGNENVTIDGAYFHDYRILLGSGAHFECVFLNGGTNITIRNSRFANCAFYDIFVARRTGDPFNGLTIENNWFDTPWNEAPGGAAQARDGAIAFSHGGDLTEPWRNVLVRFNSFHASTGISYNEDGGAITTSNNRIVGNIMESQTCVSAIWTYSFNLVNGVTCSPTDRAIGASFPYVNGAHLHVGGNWHLSGGVAVDFVLTGILDALLDTDIDGQLRPQGLARDAGADEFG